MKFVAFVLLFLVADAAIAQTQTYAEKLGFPKGKKVVIFHVDDAGMMNAMDKGNANSVSAMMP